MQIRNKQTNSNILLNNDLYFQFLSTNTTYRKELALNNNPNIIDLIQYICQDLEKNEYDNLQLEHFEILLYLKNLNIKFNIQDTIQWNNIFHLLTDFLLVELLTNDHAEISASILEMFFKDTITQDLASELLKSHDDDNGEEEIAAFHGIFNILTTNNDQEIAKEMVNNLLENLYHYSSFYASLIIDLLNKFKEYEPENIINPIFINYIKNYNY